MLALKALWILQLKSIYMHGAIIVFRANINILAPFIFARVYYFFFFFFFFFSILRIFTRKY
ncbi:hypothetical protein CFT12S02263_09450 [Campylobacter fetus subsp. testudinum]|nr:hypothetical protein CFT12S02263_09450 [Campylobacter fetus subsp. testudinum]